MPDRDPVVQDQPAITSMLVPNQSFEGLNNVNGVLPPDPNGDVGPNHYVQMVNLSFAIWNKDSTLLLGPIAINTLWAGFGGLCESNNDGDPIVLYDHLADRWLMSQFAVNEPDNFHQCIALSQTGDPTGAWYRYDFLISTSKFNDYPKFGVWPDGYYMAVNQFDGNTGNWAGQGVVAFERDQMLQGLPAQMIYFDLYPISPAFGGMLPSDLDGPLPPTGTPNYFVEMDDNAWGWATDRLSIWGFHVDWSNPSNATFGLAGLPNQVLNTASFDTNLCGYGRDCIPQPGVSTSRYLDAISDRLMYRLQYRNFGTYQTLVVNHTVDVDGTDHAGIRWYELRNSGSGWSIYQQGTFAPNADHRWMGSVAMDSAGNMVLGYSVSSSSTYPSIRYAGRLADDPPGTMPQGETTLIAGGGSQTHLASRWGDYSMLAVDPTDDCTFWYTQEYYATTRSADWRTRIGSFKFSTCAGGPADTPTPTLMPTTTTTPTATSTATTTPTEMSTAIATSTATGTATPASTMTTTVTSTPTDTRIPTATPTSTPVPTHTATATPTTTPTPASTPTPTATPTSTLTSTTDTPTLTATVTRTPTPTNTATAAPTNTSMPAGTLTPTATLTSTPTSIHTATLTATPTNTPTLTITSTGTFTATLADTPTPANTATFTATPTDPPTPTVTPTSEFCPDVSDLQIAAGLWRAQQGDPNSNYDPAYDLNDDGIINVLDLMQMAAAVGVCL